MSSKSKKYDWKEWFWAKAKEPPSPFKRRLLWLEYKPGCNEKILATAAKLMLDIDRPRDVDWTNVRQMHMYLAKDKIQDRILKSLLSNMRRMQSKQFVPGGSRWFLDFTGWQKKPVSIREHAVVEEENFKEIVDGVIQNMSSDLAHGTKLAFHLAYYLGLKNGQIGGLRVRDFYSTNGRMYLFKAGRLIELPSEIQQLAAGQIRTKLGSKVANPPLFKIETKRALSPYSKLHETYYGLKRMRG